MGIFYFTKDVITIKREYTRPSGVEQAFINAVVAGNTRSEAYRISHPESSEGLSPNVISRKAAQFCKEHPRVNEEIERLLNECAKAALITRERLISDTYDLYCASLSSATLISEETGEAYLVSDKAAKVALTASERLSKLLGYDEPEKRDATITVKFADEVKKYAK